MSVTAETPALRGLDLDELAELYRDGDDDAMRAAVLAECERQDRLEAARREREQVRAEWHGQAYADYLAAEAECRGELVNRAGVAAGVRDGFALWSGPRWLAEKYATEELTDWWLVHPRVTVGEYTRQRAAGMRTARHDALFGEQDCQPARFVHDDITAEEIAEIVEVTEDEYAECLAAVDGPAQVGLRHGSAADPVRPGRDGQQRSGAEAGPVRDARPVQPGRPAMISFSEVAPQDTMLLSRRPYLPYGEVSLLYGSGSLGKGRLVQSIIAAVTNGKPAGLDESTDDDPGDAIVVLPEDKQGESAVKRLIAAGARLERVWDMTRTPDGERFKLSAMPGRPGHLPQLRAAVEQLRADGRNPRLVVIDPLGACVGEGTILTSRGARHLVESLQDFAESTGVCVIAAAHPVSGGKLQGSWALQQALRSVFYVSQDETNPDLRVLANVKGNDVPPELAADIRFTITDGPNGPRAEWVRPEQASPAPGQARPDWRDELAARRTRKTGSAAPVPPGPPAATWRVVMTVKGQGTRILARGVTDLLLGRMMCEATGEAKALAAATGRALPWVQARDGVWVSRNDANTIAWAVAAEGARSAAV